MRRLGVLAAALGSTGAAAEELALEVSESGEISESALETVSAMTERAAEQKDYARAAQLQQLLHCLTPRPTPTCAPDATVDEQTAFLHEHGFLTIRLFEGDELARLQASWRNVHGPAKAEWEAAKLAGEGIQGHTFANSPLSGTTEFAEHGTPVTFRGRLLARRWMDIPAEDFFAEAAEPEGDGILLDMIDHPKLLPVVSAYLGDEVQLAGVSPRTYPPQSVTEDRGMEAGSYTFWHRDGSKPDGFTRPTDAHDLKVFVNFADIPEDGGCTAIVPGSHKLGALPAEIFGSDAFRHESGVGINLESMPNRVLFSVPAGTACIFDTGASVAMTTHHHHHPPTHRTPPTTTALRVAQHAGTRRWTT